MNLKLSDNALKVLERRYLKKDEQGKVVETPDEMFRRVASAIAIADKLYGKTEEEIKKLENDFYAAMASLEFLPNSPALMNAGKDLGQLSACFVLPIEDSMESIFESLKATAMIHKCLVPETFVMVDSGLKKLKDVFPGDRILTEEGYYRVSEIHKNGIKDIFEVTTERGYAIKGTAEHRLFVIDENGDYTWRQIKDLRPGDWVVLKPGRWQGQEVKLPQFKYNYNAPNSGCFKLKEVRIPSVLSIQLAELWGMYIGDGSNHRDGIRFSVGVDSKELVEYISRISLELFNKKSSISKYDNKRCYEVALLSIELKKWFEFLGITKASARQARIPEILKKADENYICGFLRGLFSTDGCIRENGHITLSTASSVLAEELQIIMLYLGIPTQKTYFAATDSYQVSICSKSGFVIFKEKIGFLVEMKQDRLNAIESEDIFVRMETIPNQRERLRFWYDGLGSDEKGKVRSSIEGIIHRPSESRQLTRQKVAAMIEEGLSPESFRQFLEDNLFYVKVAAIKPIGKKEVYDLTVPYKHSYIANGFVSHNSGGGTGFSFSRLRPKNAVVKTTGGVASGPISFMRVFDAATEAVKQGGSRRGANMGILRADHPDILEFITCKENDAHITNFNISVAITDDFMRRLAKGEDYDLIDPRSQKAVRRINTKEVFDLIVKQAHKNGEPGIIFIDRMNEFNPTPKLGKYESTNPCGEQVLLPYESCDLGSINLDQMLKKTGTRCEIDWERLKEVTALAVYFLDNLIDVNKFPLPEIEEATKATRKIGLGVMGWASLLIRLNIPYNSEEAVALAEKVMSFILNEANKKSLELGKKKGVFPAFKGSIYDKKDGSTRMRNATLTTIAPTGTISIIAGPCSSGIEPLFALSYYRKVMDNDKLVEVEPLFEQAARQRGFYSLKLMEKIAESASIKDIKEIPEDVRKVFVTSHDIAPEWHVRMQAAFQKYVHNATSKTINFPHEATIEEIRKSYIMAFDLGCKGITIYRDRSREEQVLNVGKPKEAQEDQMKHLGIAEGQVFARAKEIAPRPRPEVIIGTTTKVSTGCGNLYVTINIDEDGKPFELFTQMGKAGGCAASQLEATGRLVSLAFRANIEVKSIIDQLRNIRCPSPSWEKGQRIFSCADAIARVVERRLVNVQPAMAESVTIPMKHSHDDQLQSADLDDQVNIVGMCPDCGGTLRHEEGCVKCHGCGYSKC